MKRGDKMVNVNKLKGAMVREGYSQITLAKQLAMSKNTLNAKLNGRAKITTEEAKKMCEILHIEKEEEKVDIFLS